MSGSLGKQTHIVGDRQQCAFHSTEKLLTLKNDCFMSCPSLSDILPTLSDIFVTPSAKLSGRDLTAFETFLIELRSGFTKVSI